MKYMTGRLAAMKMGPNDARHIIWALGEFILSLLQISFSPMARMKSGVVLGQVV